MRWSTPQISWHERSSIFTIDCYPLHGNNEVYKIATAGSEWAIKIWEVCSSYGRSKREPVIRFLSNLAKRHEDTINVVRFSPDGKFLASADVKPNVLVWKLSAASAAPDIFADDGGNSNDIPNEETWTVHKSFSGHLQEVFDVAWCPDSRYFVTAAMDRNLIVWDAIKGSKVRNINERLSQHPQGVVWDPLNSYIISLNVDRSLTVFSSENFRCIQKVTKAMVPSKKGSENVKQSLFYDDSLPAFNRRLNFTADGEFLIAPAGCIETSEAISNVSYIFSRHTLFAKPCAILPCDKPSVAVRCCPVKFELHKEYQKNLTTLSYRMVFAVLTVDSVLLYDTQLTRPFAFLSNIHFQPLGDQSALNDAAWSPDGRMLIICSVDGYCTFVEFAENELGIRLKGEEKKNQIASEEKNSSNAQNLQENSKKSQNLQENFVDLMEVEEENENFAETSQKLKASLPMTPEKHSVLPKTEIKSNFIDGKENKKVPEESGGTLEIGGAPKSASEAPESGGAPKFASEAPQSGGAPQALEIVTPEIRAGNEIDIENKSATTVEPQPMISQSEKTVAKAPKRAVISYF